MVLDPKRLVVYQLLLQGLEGLHHGMGRRISARQHALGKGNILENGGVDWNCVVGVKEPVVSWLLAKLGALHGELEAILQAERQPTPTAKPRNLLAVVVGAVVSVADRLRRLLGQGLTSSVTCRRRAIAGRSRPSTR